METDTILVAVEDGRLVGFIQFGPVTCESLEATGRDVALHKIYVGKNDQGKGIGKALMQSMFEHQRLASVENVYVDVFDENTKAIGLYEKFGFRRVGKVPFNLNGETVGYDVLMKYSKR